MAEDLSAYAEFAGKYKLGTSHEATIPNDIIMQSTPAECFAFGYFDTIVSLYKKIDNWLMDDVQEAHAGEHEKLREWCQRIEEKYGAINVKKIF